MPPSALRAALRGAFAERVPVLQRIADTGLPADQLRALDLMGKYGLGTPGQVSPDWVHKRLDATLTLLEARLPPELWVAVSVELRGIWQ